MKRLMVRNVWLALFVAFLAAGVGVTPAAAQQMAAGERILIMVPRLAPMNGADDGFGKDVAEELRDMINELHTHEAVSGKNIDRARKDYDLEREDLYNCIRARQLAMQKNWGLVLCGEYERVGRDSVHVEARFVGSQDGQEFKVEPFTVHKDRKEEAAQQILQTMSNTSKMLHDTASSVIRKIG